MGERLLFVPTWLISPRMCEIVPGLRAAVTRLRASYDVDVFTWPTIRGGPDYPPTWQGGAQALRDAFTPGCHLVVMAESAQAIVALTGQEDGPATFVADGMWTPPATLRALGMAGAAHAAVSSFRGRSYQWVRLYMQDASEKEWTEAADDMDADIDWVYLGQLAPSFMALNLLQEQTSVGIPTLYLNPAVELIGMEGMTEVFQRFVPHAEAHDLRLWPGRMQDEKSGIEFADRVLAFLRKSRP